MFFFNDNIKVFVLQIFVHEILFLFNGVHTCQKIGNNANNALLISYQYKPYNKKQSIFSSVVITSRQCYTSSTAARSGAERRGVGAHMS